MKENPKESEITITDTKITGGRFQIKNVRHFHVSKCRIENNIPLVGLIEIYYDNPIWILGRSRVTTLNLAKIFPDLPEENRLTNSTLYAIYMSAKAIFELESIKRFVFVDTKQWQ